MEFGSNFVYLGNEVEDEEEVIVSKLDDGVVLSDSESDDSNDDGETCLLDILDTAGQEEFSTQKEMYVQSANGFVIIYSITDRDSLSLAEAIFTWLKRIKRANPCAILVANKQDLALEATVKSQEGIHLAQTLGIPFFETSAKTGAGVVDAMTGLVRIIPRTNTNYRIVMLGGGAVGKSSVTIRFTSNTFVDDYDPTIEDTYRKMIRVKGINPLRKEEKKALKTARIEKEKASLRLRMSPRVRRLFQKLSVTAPAGTSAPEAQSGGKILAADLKNTGAGNPPQLPPNDKVKIKEKKTDGNVVLIPMKILADEPRLVTGDPIKCGGCLAVLTSTAVLVADGDTKTWNCEFCGHKNTDLNITENEIPKGDSFDFMLSPATKTIPHNNAAEVVLEKKKELSLGVTVYCLDISVSMNRKCYVPESHVAWREIRTRGSETVTGVTRLDCIKKAIKRLAEQLKQEEPNKRVLLIVFESGVHIKAGGSSENLATFGQLDNKSFGDLIEMGLQLSRDYPLKTVEESHESIDNAVKVLQTAGSTALGPALSICAGYVSEIPGSEIVLCTDGEPNIGIGSLARGLDGAQFYRNIGKYARSKNITINILAVGESSELQTVSAAAEISGGLTSRLNPVELMRQLRLISQNEVIATSVWVMFFLAPEFVFNEIDFGDNLNKLHKEVGNVRKETDISFRFKLKDPSKKESVASVPFQIQINYTRPDGMTCLRVLSKSAPATTSRNQMEENINVSVMGVSTMKTTARLAQSNRPTEAQHLLKNVKRLVKRGAKSEEQMEEKLAFTTEVEQWDKKLTAEQSRFRSGAIDDTIYSDIQKAYMAHSTQHVTVPKKLLLLHDRKARGASSKDAYYSYKDDL